MLQRLVGLADDAGREVLAVYHAGPSAPQLKPDASPLTEADLRADAVIVRGLATWFADIPVLSEESGSTWAGGSPPQRFFLVDPLDGTREFLARNGEFTINIALIENGEAVAGVVFAPALGEMFWGAAGEGAWRRRGSNVEAIRTQAPPGPLRVTGSRSHAGDALTEWLAKLRQPHTFVAAGSSLKFCRIAEGAADVYPRPGPTNQWDTAAGHAVLQAAGGAVLDAEGQDLRYGMDRPMLNPWFMALAHRSLHVPPLA